MRCWKCGTEIEKDDRFICPACGADNAFTTEMIRNAAEGSSEAFEMLYTRSVMSVRTTVRGIIKNEDDIEDIIQETYVKAYRNLGTVTSAGAFRTWVCTIARNSALDYARKNKPVIFTDIAAENEDGEPFEYEIPETDADRIPEEHLEQREMHRLLFDELLSVLPDEQRAVVTLVLLEDRTEQEASEILGISRNTVKSRIRYARKKLSERANELKKKGVSLYGLSAVGFAKYLYSRLMITPEAEGASAAAAAVIAKVGAAGTVAGGTVKTGLSATVKLLIGGIAASIVVGGTILGSVLLNRSTRNNSDEMADNSLETRSQVETQNLFAETEGETMSEEETQTEAPSEENGSEETSGDAADESGTEPEEEDTASEPAESDSEPPESDSESPEEPSSGEQAEAQTQPQPETLTQTPETMSQTPRPQEEAPSEAAGEETASNRPQEQESEEETEPAVREFDDPEVVWAENSLTLEPVFEEVNGMTFQLDVSSLSGNIRTEVLTSAFDGEVQASPDGTVLISSYTNDQGLGDFQVRFRDDNLAGLIYFVHISAVKTSILDDAYNMEASLPEVSADNYASARPQYEAYKNFLLENREKLEEENGGPYVDGILNTRSSGTYGIGMALIEKYEGRLVPDLPSVAYNITISPEGGEFLFAGREFSNRDRGEYTTDLWTESYSEGLAVFTVDLYGDSGFMTGVSMKNGEKKLLGISDGNGMRAAAQGPDAEGYYTVEIRLPEMGSGNLYAVWE